MYMSNVQHMFFLSIVRIALHILRNSYELEQEKIVGESVKKFYYVNLSLLLLAWMGK